MTRRIAHVTLVVKDYDEAITFYTGKLGFVVVEDTMLSETKRWVLLAPSPSSPSILLGKAANASQEAHIGNQTGGRVFLFMHTDDFWRDYHAFKSKGVTFVREPSEEAYGTVAVFADLYGNLWDLIQHKSH